MSFEEEGRILSRQRKEHMERPKVGKSLASMKNRKEVRMAGKREYHGMRLERQARHSVEELMFTSKCNLDPTWLL